VLVLSWFFL